MAKRQTFVYALIVHCTAHDDQNIYSHLWAVKRREFGAEMIGLQWVEQMYTTEECYCRMDDYQAECTCRKYSYSIEKMLLT